MLKLGTCLYNFLWEDSLTDAIQHAASHGFSAIEIMATPPHLDVRSFDGARREQVLQALESRGVQVVSLNPTFIDLNLASRNETFRRESINEVKACIDAAADLGARMVVVGPGRRHPLVLDPVELSNHLAYPAIRECIEYAAARGIIYGFENITGLYMTHSEEIAAFVDKIDSPYCKIVYDVANAPHGEDPALAIRDLGSRICHVHLSDTDGKVKAHWPIGMGTIDFGAIASALRDISYSGWSFLETTWMDDPDWALSSSVSALKSLGWETA